MRFILLSIAIYFFIADTQILAQPSHITISKPVTDVRFTSEFVCQDSTILYTIRIVKGAKGNEGVMDVWQRSDLKFIKSFPLVLPIENVAKYNLLGGMMSGTDPVVFVYYYNKDEDTRSISMIQLNGSNGEIKKQSKILSVPGKKLKSEAEMANEVHFVFDTYTGRAALTLQEINYNEMKASRHVTVAVLDRDAKVIGIKEVEMPIKRWLSIQNMALSGNGQVVIQAVQNDASSNKYSKFISIVDVVQGNFTTHENLDGIAQGGVIDYSKNDIMQSQPDGSVVFFQPFTKRGVPNYGLSAILAHELDASGQNFKSILIEFKERDIVKHNAKVVPYLVDMHLSSQWTAKDGTWMFILFRREGFMDGLTHLAVVSADPNGTALKTSFFPMLEAQSRYLGIIPDDKSCWLQIGEIPSNIGKASGNYVVSTTSSKWKTELVPCLLRFEGDKFGNLQTFPGMNENYLISGTLHNDNRTGKMLNKWFFVDDKVVLTEIGR